MPNLMGKPLWTVPPSVSSPSVFNDVGSMACGSPASNSASSLPPWDTTWVLAGFLMSMLKALPKILEIHDRCCGSALTPFLASLSKKAAGPVPKALRKRILSASRSSFSASVSTNLDVNLTLRLENGPFFLGNSMRRTRPSASRTCWTRSSPTPNLPGPLRYSTPSRSSGSCPSTSHVYSAKPVASSIRVGLSAGDSYDFHASLQSHSRYWPNPRSSCASSGCDLVTMALYSSVVILCPFGCAELVPLLQYRLSGRGSSASGSRRRLGCSPSCSCSWCRCCGVVLVHGVLSVLDLDVIMPMSSATSVAWLVEDDGDTRVGLGVWIMNALAIMDDDDDVDVPLSSSTEAQATLAAMLDDDDDVVAETLMFWSLCICV
mmetsp:Transcript_11446/g.32851  ORF Transcript_11446/g.32851 Transcript_11446/m.32851 type:complete len:376 (+) Transcript_11446:1235-2362(+)